MQKVKAIFISHEHTDHTRGSEAISRKYRIPVYISAGSHKNSRLNFENELVKYLTPYEAVNIGKLQVTAFPKKHDAAEPMSFVIAHDNVTAGVFTDIGSACEHVTSNFSKCHAAFLESNYDEEMLENGSYPVYLKNRIRSEHGHLSNHQSLEIFLKHRSPSLSHLLLSHLSQDNNHPRVVLDLFQKYANGTQIAIASRHRESLVYQVTGTFAADEQSTSSAFQENYVQAKLF